MIAAALLAGLLAAPDSIAVIVVGDDAEKAGRLQAALEGSAGKTLGAAEVGARIGSPQPASTPHPDRARAKELLAQARTAFYDDRYEALLEALRKAEELALEPAEQVEVALWRASVVLALGDRPGAAKAVQAALALEPDLAVDVKVFPPPIRDIVAEEKPKVPSIPVDVPKLAPGVTLTVDGRPVGAKLSLPPGRHVAEVSGPGVRRARRVFDVAVGTPVTIDVPLAPSLDAEMASEISSAVSRADAPSNRFEIAKKLDAAVVVFAVARAEESRALVWWREDGRRAASEWRANDDRGRAALAAFVSREIAAGAPSQRDRAWRWSTILLAGGATRNLTVRGDGADAYSYRAGLGGADYRIEALAARGPWSVLVAAGGQSFAATKIQTREFGTPVSAGKGGSTVSAAAEAAWTPALGAPGESQRFDAIAALGVEWEDHGADDPGSYGFLPGHTWYAATARAGIGARFPLASGHMRVTLRGGAGLGTWQDAPRGTLGDAASVAGSYGADTSVTWQPGGTWRVGARYAAEIRAIRFRGYARTAVDPPIRDANAAETLQTVSLFAGKEF